MTDKIDMEVEAPADGKIEKIVAAPGAVLEIGKPVLIMETESQVLSFDFDEPDTEAPAQVVETPVATPVLPEVSTVYSDGEIVAGKIHGLPGSWS